MRERFGAFAKGVAAGLQLRHDHGSQYVSHHFQTEIRFLGIESSPAFVREPEGNGCAERFIRTSEGKPAVGPPLQHGRGASLGAHRLSADLQPELDHRAARLQNARSGPHRSDQPNVRGCVSANRCLKSVDRYTDHLARGAFVYVKQSTAMQVTHNLESQRRQYGLADRARQLGWQDVDVIDDDLGRSGGGIRRPGFERLLAAICEGRVGAVLSVEASRLARNGRDWHTLLEFCGLVGTLIIDEDGVYDPTSPNDRLILGMKGTMSEMELSVFRQRSIEAMRQKARRGELFLTVAVGYVKAGRDTIEKDPDRRVQEAVALVFRKFMELQTIRQVLVWLRQEKIPLPVLSVGEAADRITWRAPVYPTVHHILTDQPGLRRCLRFWPEDDARGHRAWP